MKAERNICRLTGMNEEQRVKRPAAGTTRYHTPNM